MPSDFGGLGSSETNQPKNLSPLPFLGVGTVSWPGGHLLLYSLAGRTFRCLVSPLRGYSSPSCPPRPWPAAYSRGYSDVTA